MIATLFERLLDVLIARLLAGRIISAEDSVLYRWGIRTLFIQLAHMAIIVMLGVALGLIAESLLFLFSYMPLRVNAGGYHADDNARCFTLTLVMDIVVLMGVGYLAAPWVMMFVLAAVAAAVPFIVRYAPVENRKKMLDEAEKQVYAVRTRRILAAILAAMGGFFLWGYEKGLLTLAFSLLMAMLMMLAGRVKNARQKKVAAQSTKSAV